MARLAPSEMFRRELDEVLDSVEGEADPIEAVGRLGARLILQQALEDEVTEFLGRAPSTVEKSVLVDRAGTRQRVVPSRHARSTRSRKPSNVGSP